MISLSTPRRMLHITKYDILRRIYFCFRELKYDFFRDMLSKKSYHSILGTTFWCQIKRDRKKSEFNSQKNHLAFIQQESNMSDTKIWISILYTEKNTLIATWFSYNFSSTTITVVIYKMNTYEERLESEFFMNVFTKEVLSYTTDGAWQLTWRMLQLFQPKAEI